MDIGAWLRDLGLGQYEAEFRSNEIDGTVLPHLTAEDLKDLGVSLVGHRRKLLQAIEHFFGPSDFETGSGAAEPAAIDLALPERRQLTILFADLVGSTELAVRLDAEDYRDVIGAYQEICTGAIEAAGGYLAQYLGDGVLAYFGWPLAREGDANRAARAALNITHSVRQLKMPGDIALESRVGLATGIVVVGDVVGEGEARQRSVSGETPSLAARLQHVAGPGGILADSVTKGLLGPEIEAGPARQVELAGLPGPVTVHDILSERAGRSRFKARLGVGEGELYGRDEELGLLLERWRRVANGSGGGVLLVGEAGLGKSRLCHAFSRELGSGEIQELEYQCAPDHRTTALWPVIQQIRRAASLDGAANDSERYERLQVFLGDAGRDPETFVFIASLLGLEAHDGGSLGKLSPQEIRERTLSVLAAQTLAIAVRKPLLVVFEDVHWADSTTLALISRLLSECAEAPVMVLMTSRPEVPAELQDVANLLQIGLTRLDSEAIGAIVRQVAADPLTPEAFDAIVERTDGVPLFAEELTRSVVMNQASPIPASLNEGLMERLDRIPDARDVAQTAACIGREFPVSLLETVLKRSSSECTRLLDALIEARILRSHSGSDGGVLEFRHALLRDAAYESLLYARRREVHKRIAEVLSDEPRHREPAAQAILATHLLGAGDSVDGARALLAAAVGSVRRAGAVEAVGLCKRALAALDGADSGDPEIDRLRLDLNLVLGEAATISEGYASPTCGAAFEAAVELAEALSEADALRDARHGLALFQMDSAQLMQSLETSQHIIDDAGDAPQPLALGHRLVGTNLYHIGDFEGALRHLDRALELFDEVRGRMDEDGFIHDIEAPIQGVRAMTLIALGRPRAARDAIEHALEIARANAHPLSLAFMLHNQVIICNHAGWLEDLRETVDALDELTTRHDMAFHRCAVIFGRGIAARLAGEFEKSAVLMNDGVERYRATGALYVLPNWLTELAESETARGQTEVAVATLDEAMALIDKTGERNREALVRLALARLETDPERRRQMLDQAAKVAAEQSADLWSLKIAVEKAKLLADEEPSGARIVLEQACAPFTDGVEVRDLQEARQLAARLADSHA